MGRRRLFTDQQLIALHKKGMIDREIADELGVHKTAVRKRRMKLGLKAHGHKRLFTDQQLIELHEQGFIDREIGEKLGANFRTVGKRRRGLGLEAHRRARTSGDVPHTMGGIMKFIDILIGVILVVIGLVMIARARA